MPDSNSPGGIAADHPELEPFHILLAPTTTGKEKNTIRLDLAPVACWKINDTRFEFGSSFVLPDSRSEFREAAAAARRARRQPVFGVRARRPDRG
jgi:hypothetical protein